MTDAREPRAGEAVVVAWLTHPATCLALVALLVNDHVLKAAWGNTLTGKLSDFAWLLVAPPLLATVAVLAARASRAHAPRPGVLVGASLGAAGAVFTIVKTTAVGATTASAVLSAVAGPSVVLRDPTDLVALPVLWLGWRVARARGAYPSHEARPGWRWMVALPVAVLATAATSFTPPAGTTQLAVVDEVLVVSEGLGTTHLRWFVSTDGVLWDQPESRAANDQITASFLEAGGTLEEACVPAHPLQCYRAADGLGVDRSIDGGVTWAADWAISEEVREELAERYRPRGDWLGTTGVAILPTADGFEVWAVSRGDGLAVRHLDESWERLGFPYRFDPPPVVPLPGEPTTVVYPVPQGIPLGVVAALLVLLVGSVGLPRRAERPRGHQGTVLAAVGVALAAVAALANAQEGAVLGQEVGSGFIFGGFVVAAVVVFLVSVAVGLLFGGAVLLGRKRFAGPMVFAFVGVALAAELTPPVLAIVVSVAVVAAATVVARRLDARPEPAPLPAVDYWGG